jgi:hypothetical protein
MSFLFGDQLLVSLIAFGAAFWAGARLVSHSFPLTGLLVLAFIGAMFLSDLSVFMSTDLIGAIAALAIVVFVVQYALKTSLIESAAVTAVAWIVGAALVYYAF